MPVPENECLGERMKETVLGVIQNSVDCQERELKSFEELLKSLESGKIKKDKKQIEFDIESAKSLINTNTNVLRFYKGVKDAFDLIPVCK